MQPLVATLCSVASLAALSPGQQRHLYSHFGNGAGDAMGWRVAGGGDVNGDGYADVLAGAPWDDDHGKDSGSAKVLSGRDGRVLHFVRGDAAGDWFGAAVTFTGDVDNDGRTDFCVGAPQLDVPGGTGYARLFSGRDGRVLLGFRGAAAGDRLGFALCDAGDVDRDGGADLIIGAPWADTGGTDAGAALVFSCRTGRRLRAYRGLLAGDHLGWSVAGAGDTDGDGFADVVLGTRVRAYRPGYALLVGGKDDLVLRIYGGIAPGDRFGSSVSAGFDLDGDGAGDVLVGAHATGVVRAFSGRTGLRLHEVRYRSLSEFADFTGGAGDADGDGRDDFAIGVPLGGQPQSGTVFVHSGKDATLLFALDGAPGGADFGWSVAAGGDVNGDGAPDLLAGETRGASGRTANGRAHVASSRALMLAADAHEVSLTGTSGQSLSVDAGAPYAGRLYLLLGTLGGRTPGLDLGNLRLLLNPDPYFFVTVQYPNVLMLESSFGVLDGSGRANARFRPIPLLPPSLAGATLDHACVVFGPTAAGAVSHPVPLLLAR